PEMRKGRRELDTAARHIAVRAWNEGDFIAFPDLEPGLGLRCSVHQDAAARNQVACPRASCREPSVDHSPIKSCANHLLRFHVLRRALPESTGVPAPARPRNVCLGARGHGTPELLDYLVTEPNLCPCSIDADSSSAPQPCLHM